MDYHRLINLSSFRIQNEIKLIRQENIEQDELGHTYVSSANPVKKNLARSAILSWTGIKVVTIKLELIQWRLGCIAFHQRCHSCEEPLSRNTQSFEAFASQTIIDAILNHSFTKNDESMYLDVSEEHVFYRVWNHFKAVFKSFRNFF